MKVERQKEAVSVGSRSLRVELSSPRTESSSSMSVWVSRPIRRADTFPLLLGYDNVLLPESACIPSITLHLSPRAATVALISRTDPFHLSMYPSVQHTRRLLSCTNALAVKTRPCHHKVCAQSGHLPPQLSAYIGDHKYVGFVMSHNAVGSTNKFNVAAKVMCAELLWQLRLIGRVLHNRGSVTHHPLVSGDGGLLIVAPNQFTNTA